MGGTTSCNGCSVCSLNSWKPQIDEQWMLDMLDTPFLLLMGPCAVVGMVCVSFSVHIEMMLTVPSLTYLFSMAKA